MSRQTSYVARCQRKRTATLLAPEAHVKLLQGSSSPARDKGVGEDFPWAMHWARLAVVWLASQSHPDAPLLQQLTVADGLLLPSSSFVTCAAQSIAGSSGRVHKKDCRVGGVATT